MQFLVSLRILGLMLIFFGLSHLVVIGFALWYEETEVTTFLFSMIFTVIVGLILCVVARNATQELRTRDGFFIVGLVWTVVCIFGALPFLISPSLSLSFAEAVFESVSGLTTTGSTVIVGLDHLPRAILYYRSQLHLLGGMGIIVLAVAILPLLGVGGLQLVRAEAPGPSKDNKLTPRITQTAKALWFIYMGLIIACMVSYRIGGMSMFDAICFSFATVSTGGFTPYDASFIYPEISLRLIATFFMILGVINFSLHFLCLRHKTLSYYFQDEEVRMFFLIQLIVIVLCVIMVFSSMTVLNPAYSFVEILFQVISISTTTGFTVTQFHLWPLFVPILLMFAPLIGGCTGSTAGGIKVFRMLLILKQGWREIKRMVHPHGHFLLKFNRQIVSPRVSDAVWGFVGIYFCVFVVLLLVLMALGLDFITAFSGLIASITNMGPGLGNVALHYDDISNSAKWTFSLAMLLGRLELFSILILLTPAFWRN
jgi:trk system potassium uptake protein